MRIGAGEVLVLLAVVVLSVSAVAGVPADGRTAAAEPDTADFGFYFVREPYPDGLGRFSPAFIGLSSARMSPPLPAFLYDVNLPLDSLDLEEEPWLSAKDIRCYDFAAHCIYLKAEKRDLVPPEYVEGSLPLYRPFIVVAGGERCYLASFQSVLSSSIRAGPRIEEMEFSWGAPDDIICIGPGVGAVAWSDERNDPRVRAVLEKLGLLREGIQIDLRSVRLLENGSRGAKMEYTLEIINYDIEDLAVPDAEEMGASYFYYDHGLALLPSDRLGEGPSGPEVKKPGAGFCADGCYVIVKSGASIEQTIVKPTEPIPPGRYSCRATFRGGLTGRTKDDWNGVRIWIGDAVSGERDLVVPE